MPYVYILRGSGGRLYTGITWNLSHILSSRASEVAVAPHSDCSPPHLVYVEWHERIDEAYYRERQIHGWRRYRKDRLIDDVHSSDEPGA